MTYPILGLAVETYNNNRLYLKRIYMISIVAYLSQGLHQLIIGFFRNNNVPSDVIICAKVMRKHILVVPLWSITAHIYILYNVGHGVGDGHLK